MNMNEARAVAEAFRAVYITEEDRATLKDDDDPLGEIAWLNALAILSEKFPAFRWWVSDDLMQVEASNGQQPERARCPQCLGKGVIDRPTRARRYTPRGKK